MADSERCTICQTWRATPGTCQQVACLACGTVQCHSNGTARGTCRHCYFGRLPGWSFSHAPKVCQYKGCVQAPVYAWLPGSKAHCCKAHGDQVLARRQLRQAQAWKRYGGRAS